VGKFTLQGLCEQDAKLSKTAPALDPNEWFNIPPYIKPSETVEMGNRTYWLGPDGFYTCNLPGSMEKRIAELERDRDAAWAESARLSAILAKSGMNHVPESTGAHPYHGPVKDGESIHDVAHERFHGAVGDVLSGKIMPEARRQMQEALKNVPKEPATIPRLMPKLEKGVRVL
jgi:hypothetical protein